MNLTEALIQELATMERRLLEIDKTLTNVRLQSTDLHIANASNAIGRAYGGLRDAQRSLNMILQKGGNT